MSTIGDISYRTKWIISKRYMQAALVIGLMTLVIAIPFFTRAFALTDVGNAGVFELDGNIVKDSSTALPTDWGALFNSAGVTQTLPPGGLDAHWVNDGPHAVTDNTTFTTGSKDTLDISANWACTPSNNITPKDDILHSYSFAIVPQSGSRAGHLMIYGGFERFANNGAGDLGLWLLQDPTVGCSSTKGAVSFTGVHAVGDLLVVAEFSTGGSVTTLNLFEWVGITKASPLGVMNVTANGGADCTVAPVTANICARSNTGSISTPWSTQDKTSAPNTLATAEFFEVGIDLTGLFGSNAPCVNRFLFDTRTSPTLTATLVDYAEGVLTTCPHSQITTTVSPSTIALGGSATDTATVKLDQGSAMISGTVDFRVYGPVATNTPTCTTQAGFFLGVPISGPGTGATATSGSFTPSSPGYYFWTATYNPASVTNGDKVSTSCGDAGETLTVVQSSITTSVTTPIALGQSTTDTATVTLTPSGQTVAGTVTFKVYGPFTSSVATSATCTSGNLVTPFSPNTVSIGPSSSPATATSGSFTPSAAGYYFWTASYAPTGLANGNAASTACGDGGETLLVIGSSIVTAVSPSTITFGGSATDTATVTLIPAGQTVSGTVTFNVYGPFNSAPTASSCVSGSLVTSFSPDTKTISGASPASVTSDPFTPSAPGYYAWIASYSPSGPANGPPASTSCGDNGETLLVTSIPKITAFDFTNTPTNNDPTTGSGVVTYSVKIHNYGGTAVTLSGSLTVGGSASVSCIGGNSLTLSGSLAAGGDATFSMTCNYSGTSGQTVSATATANFTDPNGLTGAVSGSPTTYTFTIQQK
jgi:hypothetical protein